MRFRPGQGITARLIVAAFAASLVEGIETGRATAAAHEASSVAPGAWAAFATVLLPSLLAALVLGAPFDARVVRQVKTGARRALPGARGFTLLGLSLFAGAIGLALLVARRSASRVTANVTLSLALVTLVSVLVLGAPLVIVAASALGPLARRLRGRVPPFVHAYRGVVPAALATMLLVAAARPLFPASFLSTLSGGIVGYCLASAGVLRVTVARALGPRRGLVVLAALAAVALPEPFLLGHLPAQAQTSLLFRSPLSGSIVTGLRGLVDRDHDGYSPILLGGDCNDHDPAINPGRADEPGNGIDENCSGADATPYVPYRQPALAPASATTPPVPSKPNMVVILIDALRPDHLHFAGYHRPTSPNLDAFRQRATWFDNAYTAAASTRFALASVMTGLDVERIPQIRSRVDLEINPGGHVLGERLAALGYDRVGYTISYVVQHIRGVGGGFRVWEPPWPVEDWRDTFADSATRTTDSALAYLGTMPADGSKPYFLLLHYQCTHDPYAAQPRWNFGKSPLDSYDSALAYCDDEIGRLLRAMDARADEGRTATFVVSDHGELFGEHGFTEHGSSLFEPDVRVLLLARLPFLRAPLATPPRTVTTPVSLTDLEPTLVWLAGGTDAETYAWNLWPLLTQGDAAGDRRRPIFLYTDLTKGTVRHQARGVLLGRYKYVRDVSTGTHALYDLSLDAGETKDLSISLPVERARLAELLESWERGVVVGPPTR